MVFTFCSFTKNGCPNSVKEGASSYTSTLIALAAITRFIFCTCLAGTGRSTRRFISVASNEFTISGVAGGLSSSCHPFSPRCNKTVFPAMSAMKILFTVEESSLANIFSEYSTFPLFPKERFS